MLLTAVALVAVLSADIVSLKLVYQFEGNHKKMFEEPALATDTDNSGTTTFTIHADANHTSVSGTVVKVWIDPGMSQANPIPKNCIHEKCRGDQPDKDEIRSLFTQALNAALVENTAGLGHYRVVACGEKESETVSWLDLERTVDLAMDTRHNYFLAKCCRNGRPSKLTQLGLGIERWDYEHSRAKFVPMPSKQNAPALAYVLRRCGKPKELAKIWFVTQLINLSEETNAKPETKQGGPH